MLYHVEPGPALDAKLAALNPDYPLLMQCWLNWGDITAPRTRLVDDPDRPRVFVGGVAGWLNFIGDEAALRPAMEDLLNGRVSDGPVWPDEHTRRNWAEHDGGRPTLRLEGHGQRIHGIAHELGLVEVENKAEEDGAYFYYIDGAPRFASEVRHPCRIAHGQELFELMCQGTDYDESGTYTRACLEQHPSFVCEVGGEPVCWSCLHVGGALGMIYTPPEHRRHGYARSLAAFQVDYVLGEGEIAWCAILGVNRPSQGMVESLGAKRMEGRMYWRRYEIPPETPCLSL